MKDNSDSNVIYNEISQGDAEKIRGGGNSSKTPLASYGFSDKIGTQMAYFSANFQPVGSLSFKVEFNFDSFTNFVCQVDNVVKSK